MPHRGRASVLLGIVGDSGSGKSTLGRGIQQVLGPDRVTTLSLDDYHRHDRKTRARIRMTALNPDANHLDLMGQHLALLARGEAVYKPVYDHTTGCFSPGEMVNPRALVVVSGLLGLHTAALRDTYGLTVYLDPDPDLRARWKIQRDTTERGYAPADVRAQLERRRADAAAFIQPQADHADLTVQCYPPPGWWARQDPGLLNVRIVLRRYSGMDVLEELVPPLRPNATSGNGEEPSLSLHPGRDGDPAVLDIRGNISEEMVVRLEDLLWTRMDRGRHPRPAALGLLGSIPGGGRSRSLALTQSLVTLQFLEAAEGARGHGMVGV